MLNNQTATTIELLEEAVDTLKRLPSQSLKAKMSSWPDVVKSSAELYMSMPNFIKPAAATPDAIDRLDLVLDGLIQLNAQERRILWARASKISWRRLEQFENLSHTTLRKYHQGGLERLNKLR